jgi:hemolysin activation/secretion protein
MRFKLIGMMIAGVLVSSKLFAADNINSALSSASINPSQVGQQLNATLNKGQQKPMPPVSSEEKKAFTESSIPNAKKIHFFLKKLTVTGNTVYSQQQLLPLYQSYLNHDVTLADIQNVAHEITLKYRQEGYILSRAVLPAQVIQNGSIKIQIIEGYIQSATVKQGADGAKKLLSQYGDKLTLHRPINIHRLERYALLSNDIPGMEGVKTVLSPPQDKNAQLGATEMTFEPNFSKATVFLNVDNRLTKYLGQSEYSAGGAVNSVIQSGDQLGIQGLASNRWKDLRYLNLYTIQPLGSTGSSLILSNSTSLTAPEFLLKPLKIKGKSQEWVASIKTPWYRSRQQGFSTVATLDYLNSKTDVNAFNINLYDDHLRSGRVAANYYRQDSFNGQNLMSVQLSHGLPIWGASKANQVNLSRIKGDPEFTKWDFSYSRLQGITDKVSLYLAGISQYSYQPLLTSEQFTLGGVQYGQAYDPAELSGDKGIAGKLELRYNAAPGWAYLNNIQYFAFYDIGKINNIEPQSVNGLDQNVSAASAGTGLRVNFGPYLYGTGTLAKPLTRDVGTLNNRKIRAFFSLTLTGKMKPSAEDGNNDFLNSAPLLTGAATNGPEAKASSSGSLKTVN